MQMILTNEYNKKNVSGIMLEIKRPVANNWLSVQQGILYRSGSQLVVHRPPVVHGLSGGPQARINIYLILR